MRNRRPRLVLLENVTVFLTSRSGKDFRAAMLELNRLGYAVDPLIIEAIRFVPQSRPRLFVVGELAEDAGAPSIALVLRLLTKGQKMRVSLRARFDRALLLSLFLQIRTSIGDCATFQRCRSRTDD
jgi:site-specific DNA-cytosine methylase